MNNKVDRVELDGLSDVINSLNVNSYRIVSVIFNPDVEKEKYIIFSVKDTTEQAAFDKIANGVLNVSL